MENPICDISSSKELSLFPWVPGGAGGRFFLLGTHAWVHPDGLRGAPCAPTQRHGGRFWGHGTFQAEDAVAQSVHDVVEGGLVGDVEEIFLVRVAGDVLDLADEVLGVLLAAQVMPQHLRRGLRPQPGAASCPP